MVGAGVPSTMPQSSLLDPSTARSVGGGYVPRPPLMMHQSYVLQVSQVGVGWLVGWLKRGKSTRKMLELPNVIQPHKYPWELA